MSRRHTGPPIAIVYPRHHASDKICHIYCTAHAGGVVIAAIPFLLLLNVSRRVSSPPGACAFARTGDEDAELAKVRDYLNGLVADSAAKSAQQVGSVFVPHPSQSVNNAPLLKNVQLSRLTPYCCCVFLKLSSSRGVTK